MQLSVLPSRPLLPARALLSRICYPDSSLHPIAKAHDLEACLLKKLAAPAFLCLVTALLLSSSLRPQQRDWFRISTGIGQQNPRIAVSDFASKSDQAKS